MILKRNREKLRFCMHRDYYKTRNNRNRKQRWVVPGCLVFIHFDDAQSWVKEMKYLEQPKSKNKKAFFFFFPFSFLF